MEIWFILFWLAIGLFFGIGSGMTGLSAVNLILPILYTVFSFGILMAIGTSLFIDMINSAIVALFYARHANVDFKIGLMMGIISFMFAILGAHIAFIIASASEDFLAGSFGILQLFIGVAFIYRVLKKSESTESGEMTKTRVAIWFDKIPDNSKKFIIIIASVILGFIGGLLGAGGGFVITFILIFLLSLESHKAVGTACFVMFFTTAGAVLYYSTQFSIDFGFGGLIGVFSIIGAFIGTQAAHKLSEKHLTFALGLMILVFGILMILY